ncbi:MAG: isoprenylcysteine carboxylmethyltransferase family protein [Gammaproteobacteria bacterium]|nr:isoprenylcysteine carboxylmethyltransferase family protein [Gammaproteobacteria bacterium]
MAVTGDDAGPSTPGAQVQQQSDKPGVAVFPPLFFAAALILALVLNWLWPLPLAGRGALPALELALGLALVLAGAALLAWGRRTMLRAGTPIDPSQPTTAIITDGPFRHTRNPLYLSLILLFVGLSLIADTAWGPLLLLLAVLPVLHFGVIRREERYLERKFGDVYRAYRRRVRRYL